MDDFIIDQTNLMRKIRLSYESFKSLGEGATLGVLESRLELLEKNWNKFEGNHREMLSIKLPEDSLRPYFADNLYDISETIFGDVRGQYWEHRNAFDQQDAASQASLISQAPAVVSRKLPVIPIPRFNGEPTAWIAYRDMFTAIVVNSQLSNVEKLMHLRDSLSGDPLFLVKNVSVTDQNFDIAWKKVKNHYNNNRRIIYSHVSTLLDIPSMKSGSAAELKSLFNSTVDAVESLRSLNAPVDH